MNYQEIIDHYEACLLSHGDTHLGVDWPRKEDAIKRYSIMLDLIRGQEGQISVLDFGCGAAHLYDYIIDQGITRIDYAGLDISDKFIALCRKKYPKVEFHCADILANDALLNQFDYIVMNGVFTEKQVLTHQEMTEYFQLLLKKIFPLARKGIAFNVMSKLVDWERNDLFHLSLDEMAAFVTETLSRNFVIRQDYGLYEYTVYLFHDHC